LNLLYEAISLHRQGNLIKAVQLYRQVLRSTPNESNALKFLGLIELQSGNLENAYSLLSSSIEANPNSADCHYYLARLHLQKTELERARRHFESVIRLEEGHVDALTCLGILSRDKSNPAQALNYFHRATLFNPRAIDALLGKGVCLIELGRDSEAISVFNHILSMDQRAADAWQGRGTALRKLKRYGEAIAAHEQALAIDPNHAQSWMGLGNVFSNLRRHEDAIAAFDKALAIKPDLAEAHYGRGNVFFMLKRYRDADSEYERALSVNPDLAQAWAGRGNVLAALSRPAEAAVAYDKALTINASCLEGWVGRGSICRMHRQYENALDAYNKALAFEPSLAEAWCGCGNALSGLRRHDEAMAAYEKALAIEPASAEAWFDCGILFESLGRFDDAKIYFCNAISLDPNAKFVLGHFVHTRMQICEWRDLAEDTARLISGVQAGECVAEPFALLSTDATAADQLRCSQIYIANQAFARANPSWQGRKYRHDRVRVAYVSANFREHPVAFLMAGLFERHDRSRFETFAISLSPDEPSEMRERLRGAFDGFVDVSQRSDGDVVELLSEMEIDIAVDLMGYTRDSRTNIFACRPSPIQVNYLGYPSTIGADFIDYVIADKIVLPFDQQPQYAERIVHLPDCYLVNDAARSISPQAPSRANAGLPEQGFVFCCFNSSYKISLPIFEVWMRLLARIDGSVLWLSQVNDCAARNLRTEASDRGVDPGRLIFARRVSSIADHLARQQLADLFVDTLPYNAHSTASDALWGGLPVLTCAGHTFAGRVAASLLNAVGLPELVTNSLEEYETLAVELANDRERLQMIRHKLQANRLTYPLFDTDGFRRHIEVAYLNMWEMWQRGEAPRAFAVEA
jgi:protein O-GlcNAc transferase